MSARVIVIMGVSASGKTTIGEALAHKNNFLFVDGDNLHSANNIEKMKAGIALTDGDREGWFVNIINVANKQLAVNETVVIACSALKRKYRNTLRKGIKNLLFVYLKITFEQALQQAAKRKDHFMPVTLLKSQFEILEEPQQDEEDTITIIPDSTVKATLSSIKIN